VKEVGEKLSFESTQETNENNIKWRKFVNLNHNSVGCQVLDGPSKQL